MSRPSLIRILKKIIIGTFLGLTSFSTVCLAALFIWVMTGPRSINSVTPYIESALSAPDGSYKVRIENSEVVWDGWNSPLGISADNVEIINDKGAVLSYFPKILIKLYVHKLLLGELDVKTLELDHPSVTLIQNEDGNFTMGSDSKIAQTNNSIGSVLSLLLSEDSSNPVKHLKLMTIKHASLSVENKITGQFMQSPDASLEMTRRKGVIKGSLNMPVTFGDTVGSINADFGIDRTSHDIGNRIFFKNIPTSALHQLFPTQKWLESIHLTASGSAQLDSDFATGNVKNIDFVLETGQGNIKYPELLDSTLNLQSAKITGSISDNLTTFKIGSAKVSVITSTSKTVDLLFNGMAKKVGDDYAIDGYGETANAPVNDIHMLWPISLSPESRKWVINHISNGTVAKADVTLHFKPGDLRLKDVPEAAVASTISIRNTTVKYLPSHPPVTDVDAVVKFTGKAMDAKIISAKYMGNSQITSASVTMPNMYPDDVRMNIDMNAIAPAQDVAEFLMLPRIEAAESLGITKNVTGMVNGNVKLNFVAFSVTGGEKKQGSDMHYSVDGNLVNVSQNHFLNKYDIADANMKLLIDNKDIKLSGKATLNTVPMSVQLHSNFDKVQKTEYSVACNMPLPALPKFGFPALSTASGSIGVNADFSESSAPQVSPDGTKALLDLTNMDISLPEYGFNKKSGDKATLDLVTETTPAGDTLIKSILLKGANTTISGSGEYNKTSNEITALKLDRLNFGNNDLTTLDYQKTAGGIKLVAIGNSFDLSPYLNGNKSKNQSLNIDIETNHLIFGENKQMQSAVLRANCAAICSNVNLSAKLPDNSPFNYAIKNGAVNASTPNAGELFSVLGITDTVTGGSMNLLGMYNNSKITGRVVITNYTLRKAPILTKMLTIASLTGVIDTLSGKGISFKKLYAPFTYGEGVIVLKDAKAHGDALGITTSGTIDNANSTLDLNGLLIPSYTMNTLIGNVPVIGNLLMGGKGKGIFGMNYSVSGKMSDPSIRVNPLSVLTPGFLRGIFDVFDEPPPDIDKIMAERKAQDAKKADPSLPPMTPLSNSPPPQ